MSNQRSIEKILTFPSKGKTYAPGSEMNRAPKEAIHPAVRRRRLLWFGCMVAFVMWFLVSIVFQQFRIWDREDKMMAKKNQMEMAKVEMTQLNQSIKKLKKENLLARTRAQVGL